MKMIIRNDRDMRCVPRLVGLLAAALIASSGGCLVPDTVLLGGLQPVSEGIAKRDLGIDYLSSGRTAMAIRELTTSIQAEPDDPETHLWLGEAYRRKGKNEEAESYLFSAVRLAKKDGNIPAEHAARLNLSALLSQLGRYDEALEHCEALSADPTFAAPWRPLTNCGWALLQLGRFDEARASFEEALSYFPRFGPALLNLGILLNKQGHTLAAIKTLERALDSGRLGASALGEAHYRLGEIYVGLGRRDKAVEHFREASDNAPFAEWSVQSQAYLDLLH